MWCYLITPVIEGAKVLVNHPQHLRHLRADELVHGGALPLGPPQVLHLLPEVRVDVEADLESGSLQGHLY